MAMVASQTTPFADVSWDETIVPTLRKRLENESRVISKRMSAASIGNSEDAHSSFGQTSILRISHSGNKDGGRVTPSSTSTEKPSAIPRPSLNHSRPSVNSTHHVPSDFEATPAGRRRSRTFSSPYAFDKDVASQEVEKVHYVDSSAANGLPTPASSRSNSPAVPSSKSFGPKPTRIPMATAIPTRSDGRTTPSDGSYMQIQSSTSGWPVYENAIQASTSNVSISIVQHSIQNVIKDEAPPFNAASNFSDIDADLSRLSVEEEHPFEHWYRGDVSRNGGVGELRVANRLEMLEIANFGHKLRHFEHGNTMKRRRAGSIGPRQSILFDDHAYDDPGQYVLDETPLTDMDQDSEYETDRDTITSNRDMQLLDQNEVSVNVLQTMDGSRSVPAVMAASDLPPSATQIPRAAQKQNTARIVDVLETSGSTAQSISSSVSTAPPSTPSTSRMRSLTNSKKSIPHSSVPVSPAAKRGRTKSPPSKTPTKKPKASTYQNKRSKSAIDVRSSRAEYPEVPDGMADAIPSWTQPKDAGNWDEVVLPVVARKMGLQDQYEEADGSPRPVKRPSQDIIPPQPGTFGIDLSKHRQREGYPRPRRAEHAKSPRSSGVDNSIMREESDGKSQTLVSEPDNRTNAYCERNAELPKPHLQISGRCSPPPFSHYREANTSADSEQREKFEVEDVEPSGGCCKCIIM